MKLERKYQCQVLFHLSKENQIKIMNDTPGTMRLSGGANDCPQGLSLRPPLWHKQGCISSQLSVRKYAFNYHLRCNLSEVLVSLVFNENWFSDCITPKAKDNGNPWFFPETFSHHMFLRRSRRHGQPLDIRSAHMGPRQRGQLVSLKVILMNEILQSWAWLTSFAAKWVSPREN